MSKQNPAALKGGKGGTGASLKAVSSGQENAPEQRRRASTSSASLTTRPPLLRVESSARSLNGSTDCLPCAQLQAQLTEAEARAVQATESQSTLLAQRDTARAELDHVLNEVCGSSFKLTACPLCLTHSSPPTSRSSPPP